MWESLPHEFWVTFCVTGGGATLKFETTNQITEYIIYSHDITNRIWAAEKICFIACFQLFLRAFVASWSFCKPYCTAVYIQWAIRNLSLRFRKEIRVREPGEMTLPWRYVSIYYITVLSLHSKPSQLIVSLTPPHVQWGSGVASSPGHSQIL